MARVLVSGLVLLLSMTIHTSAFEQTEVLPKSVPDAAAAVAAPVDGVKLPEVSLDVPEATEKKASGPAISIPGFGQIGTLPRLDFGLELLYGADDAPAAKDEDETDADLRIRGSVKHKF